MGHEVKVKRARAAKAFTQGMLDVVLTPGTILAPVRIKPNRYTGTTGEAWESVGNTIRSSMDLWVERDGRTRKAG